MSGVLISETTREERERLVAESLGNVDVACDGCAVTIRGRPASTSGTAPSR